MLPASVGLCLVVVCACGAPGTKPLADGGSGISVKSLDVCAQTAKAIEEAQYLLGECAAYYSTSVPLTEASCRQRLASCGAEDLEQIDLFFDCMRRVAPCKAANRGVFSSAAGGCVPLLMPISSACRAAFSN